MTHPVDVLRSMVDAALAAADPYQLVKQYLQHHHLPEGNWYLIGVGKAAVPMARAACDHFGDAVQTGVVISKLSIANLPNHLTYVQGNHPIPGDDSIRGTEAIEKMLSHTTPVDQVLCLISGGTSTLLTKPVLPLLNWQQLNQSLIECGCTINAINHIRQHFDVVKGGGLLHWVIPANCTSLILSDVIGNRLEHIGSGPTVPTSRDVAHAQQILSEFHIWERLDETTTSLMQQQLQSVAAEPQPAYPSISNQIIGDVRRSAEAAAERADRAGYEAKVIRTDVTGEAREVGAQLVQAAQTMPPGTCHVYGGETTVTINAENSGQGGRNQELALAAAIALAGSDDLWLGTLATDGEDGPNDGAGAFVNGKTVGLARQKGLSADRFLANHDSYTFFKLLDQHHLRIGSTGTNVNDLIVVLKEHA